MASHTFPDLDFRSSLLPGGSFVHALWNRDLMRFSDRGRASEAIGDRWADLSAAHLNGWIGATRTAGESEHAFTARQIVRLDDTPALASAASRRQLPNPDFVVIGDHDGGTTVQSVDAKFSVETASAKQVSADVMRQVWDLRTSVPGLFPDEVHDPEFVDGLFLSPDFSLTHYMLQGKRSVRGALSVERAQVELVPVSPEQFMDPLQAKDLALWLGTVDSIPFDPESNLLSFIYYFRLASACSGFWVDESAPLFAINMHVEKDFDAIGQRARWFFREGVSAWGLIQTWNADSDLVRALRQKVERAAGMPITNAELRDTIERVSTKARLIPPSNSKVRRSAGSWFKRQMLNDVGEVRAPVADESALLASLSSHAQSLKPKLMQYIEETVVELATEMSTAAV